jgi:hypothetical protein
MTGAERCRAGEFVGIERAAEIVEDKVSRRRGSQRRVRVLLGAAVVLSSAALPSEAARPLPSVSRVLYFDNAGVSDATACTPSYVLSAAKPVGQPCLDRVLVKNLTAHFGSGAGVGSNIIDSYQVPGSFPGRIDVSKPLTGTVYIAMYRTGCCLPNEPKTQGGPVGASIKFSINGVVVGKAEGSATVMPGDSLAIPVTLAIPRSLANQPVTSLEAEVTYTSGLGSPVVSYDASSRSQLAISTR